jgi:hypothetical protein
MYSKEMASVTKEMNAHYEEMLPDTDAMSGDAEEMHS